MTSHILLSRPPRLLYLTVILLFAARLCQAACVPTDTTRLPSQRPNQDVLALLLKAQAKCPLTTLDFLKLVEGSGARLEPTMVNFRGFHNQDRGLFFVFEIVSGPLASLNVERGDFLFGHFLSNAGSQLVLQKKGLLIEAIVWDPTTAGILALSSKISSFFTVTPLDKNPFTIGYDAPDVT
jgi:hypothetical protein